MGKGKFIVCEGPNGSGKTTIMDAVCEKLNESGRSYYRTKEPTKSELGMFIRKNQNVYSKEVLACMVAANRYEHLQEIVEPEIEKGNLVLSDRYFPSSLVYQRMDGLNISFIEGLNQRIRTPELTIFLMANESLLKERLSTREEITRFELHQRQEIQMYNEAAAHLIERKWNVTELDASAISIRDAAELIVKEITKLV